MGDNDYSFLLNMALQIPLAAAVFWAMMLLDERRRRHNLEIDERHRDFIKGLVDEFREAEKRREGRYRDAENRFLDIILRLLETDVKDALGGD